MHPYVNQPPSPLTSRAGRTDLNEWRGVECRDGRIDGMGTGRMTRERRIRKVNVRWWPTGGIEQISSQHLRRCVDLVLACLPRMVALVGLNMALYVSQCPFHSSQWIFNRLQSIDGTPQIFIAFHPVGPPWEAERGLSWELLRVSYGKAS